LTSSSWLSIEAILAHFFPQIPRKITATVP